MRKSISNYLKTIYEAGYTQNGTNNKQIATMLGVLPGSVTEAVSHLEKMGFVTRKTYHEITLTAAGYQLVQDLMFRYRLCEVWLAQTIKLPLVAIPEQAWLMAAINDQDLLKRLNQQLATPRVSPFGGPLQLPTFETQHDQNVCALSTVAEGCTVTLASYLETTSIVKYLEHTSLQLNQRLTVVSQSNSIPVITLVDQHQREYLLNAAVARYIYVQPIKALVVN
ncbi:metal-dependent transcriptional regulator [Lactiplantibacillus garii]|uniref:Metal-dependent transcriptional regulator n=1 Tax=Lactiplantibacillus garii TaxID=2306423 RepID=A0A3R8J654_9LACO|nr:metal-dependent transcriptional regulator [Lactiplantibacillus garii]RRK09572.1 metal-dependent transcriptional regulator [Lactiplantibacillus garii]